MMVHGEGFCNGYDDPPSNRNTASPGVWMVEVLFTGVLFPRTYPRKNPRFRDKYGGRVSGDVLVPCDSDEMVSLADALYQDAYIPMFIGCIVLHIAVQWARPSIRRTWDATVLVYQPNN